jgi:chemotaxis receptor (MCP) glutamine deamidase CheD
MGKKIVTKKPLVKVNSLCLIGACPSVCVADSEVWIIGTPGGVVPKEVLKKTGEGEVAVKMSKETFEALIKMM